MTEKQLEEKIVEYEAIIGIGKNDVARNAFVALCKALGQQSKRIEKFNLDTEIAKFEKDDKIYDRTMDIIIKMPKMILDINNIRKELGISLKDMGNGAFVDGVAEKRT